MYELLLDTCFKRPSFGVLFSALSHLKNEQYAVVLYRRRGESLSLSKTQTKLDGVCIKWPALNVFVSQVKFRGFVSFIPRRTITYTG